MNIFTPNTTHVSKKYELLLLTFITLYQILYTNSCDLSKCLCIKGKCLVICPVLNLYHIQHLVAKQQKDIS